MVCWSVVCKFAWFDWLLT